MTRSTDRPHTSLCVKGSLATAVADGEGRRPRPRRVVSARPEPASEELQECCAIVGGQVPIALHELRQASTAHERHGIDGLAEPGSCVPTRQRALRTWECFKPTRGFVRLLMKRFIAKNQSRKRSATSVAEHVDWKVECDRSISEARREVARRHVAEILRDEYENIDKAEEAVTAAEEGRYEFLVKERIADILHRRGAVTMTDLIDKEEAAVTKDHQRHGRCRRK